MKVLVVDDVGYSRHYYVRLLQKQGYKTFEAGCGAEALKALQTFGKIDAVLTDLKMPDMDGIDLFKSAMQMDWSNSRIAPAFLLMTAFQPGKNAEPKEAESVRVAKTLGFDDILFKPVDPAVLVDALKTIAAKRAAAQQKPPAEEIDFQTAINQICSVVNQVVLRRDTATADKVRCLLNAQMLRLETLQVAQPVG